MASSAAIIRRDLLRTVGNVLRTPTRFRRLLRLGPAGLMRMTRFLGKIVPHASRELAAIRLRAAQIPDPGLREQALASIDHKAYHVQGGCILATFLPQPAARRYVAIIAPLETIYDYLDNLCDRLPGVEEQAYGTLHEALLDALDDRRPLSDYYRAGPFRDDGGYLAWLVDSVRRGIALLPHHDAVRAQLVDVAQFYAELQTYKHAMAERREDVCRAWYERNRERFPGMYWWEFAAACGSSLPVFALLFLASHETLDPHEVARTLDAYFPNVSAVHILLDYFIDQAEDREHRELNFVACYATSAEAVERVRRLVATTSTRLRTLADSDWHEFLLQAMCLFYLTHPKVFEQRLEGESAELLAALG